MSPEGFQNLVGLDLISRGDAVLGFGVSVSQSLTEKTLLMLGLSVAFLFFCTCSIVHIREMSTCIRKKSNVNNLDVRNLVMALA